MRRSPLLLAGGAIGLLVAILLAVADEAALLPVAPELGGTVGLLALVAFDAGICLAARERGRAPRWMVSGVVAAVAGALVGAFIGVVGTPKDPDELLLATLPAFLMGGWAAAMAATGAILLPRVRTRLGLVARIVGITSAALGILALVTVLPAAPLLEEQFGQRQSDRALELVGRFGSICAILAATMMILLWSATRLPRLLGREDVAARQLAFDLTCPRCGAACRMRGGGDRCAGCGLEVRVTPA